MIVWWGVWAAGVALPVCAVVLQLRHRPHERWRLFGGGAPWFAYVMSMAALLCLLVSTRQLSRFEERLELVGLGGALVSLGIASLIGRRHNARLTSS